MGFLKDDIAAILDFPDLADNSHVPKAVFDVIYSLGRDAENEEEAQYAYEQLIALCKRSSPHVRGYSVMSLGLLSQRWHKVMQDDYDEVAAILLRELETGDAWELGQLEAARADFRQFLGWKFEFRRPAPQLPTSRYTMRGAHLRKLRLKKQDKRIEARLRFADGFFMPAPGQDVSIKGKVIVEDVDVDASSVELFEQGSKFKGKRISLRTFEEKYPEVDFEITEVLCGHGATVLEGNAVKPAGKLGFRIRIVHKGRLIFATV